jgi:hypothetical protein
MVMGSPDVLLVDIVIDTPDELFAARAVNPLTEDYASHGDVSGVEHAVNEFYARPSYKSMELHVSLPASEITPETANRMSVGISRWCRARLRDVNEEIRASLWRGRRTLLIALVALFFLIGLSKILAKYDNIVLEILSEGFSIAGWVVLWVGQFQWSLHGEGSIEGGG